MCLAIMLPVLVLKFHSLFGLKELSPSKKLTSPTPAIICPTGKADPERSDAALVTLKLIKLGDMLATNLGDISISSSGVFGVFIVSTRTLMPFIQTNSL